MFAQAANIPTTNVRTTERRLLPLRGPGLELLLRQPKRRILQHNQRLPRPSVVCRGHMRRNQWVRGSLSPPAESKGQLLSAGVVAQRSVRAGRGLPRQADMSSRRVSGRKRMRIAKFRTKSGIRRRMPVQKLGRILCLQARNSLRRWVHTLVSVVTLPRLFPRPARIHEADVTLTEEMNRAGGPRPLGPFAVRGAAEPARVGRR